MYVCTWENFTAASYRIPLILTFGQITTAKIGISSFWPRNTKDHFSRTSSDDSVVWALEINRHRWSVATLHSRCEFFLSIIECSNFHNTLSRLRFNVAGENLLHSIEVSLKVSLHQEYCVHNLQLQYQNPVCWNLINTPAIVFKSELLWFIRECFQSNSAIFIRGNRVS